MTRAFATLALLLAGTTVPTKSARAQEADPQDRAIVIAYHRVSQRPLDLAAAAARSEAAQRATPFDRPDAIKAESERLAREIDSADGGRTFTLRVADNVSEYDHTTGRFTVQLFDPGHYAQVDAFGERYQMVFDNAAAARYIVMPKEQARAFDARLVQSGRSVVDEIQFRVVGEGDPAGAVTGPRVIRANIVAVRVLDRAGGVLYAPTLAPARASVAASAPPPAFEASRTDVAGLRVGVAARDLEGTLTRLFGPVTRLQRAPAWHPGLSAALEVNSMGCMTIPGRRRGGEAGNVCVTAFLDEDDVVREVRVERVFAFLDAETFRATMVRRYGVVSDARQGSAYSLGWGPRVPETLGYSRAGPLTALTAHYDTIDDMMSRSLNAAPRVRVTLQLVDAAWAAKKQ
jgi:hypothetical protein